MADERLLAIAKRETHRNPDDIDSVVRRTHAAAKRSAWFSDILDDLASVAIRGIVNDLRHSHNTQIKRDNGQYGGEAKVVPGEATARVAASIYTYMIAGKTLGSVRGDELEGIAQDEAAIAKGHQFNAKLCRKLKPLVADNKTVRDCLSERKLKTIFQEAS